MIFIKYSKANIIFQYAYTTAKNALNKFRYTYWLTLIKEASILDSMFMK